MWKPSSRVARECLCSAILGTTRSVLAQQTESRTELSLAQALERTLERNPELIAIGFGRQGIVSSALLTLLVLPALYRLVHAREPSIAEQVP